MIQRAFLFLFLVFISFAPAQASFKYSGSVETYFRQYSFSAGEEYSNQSGGLNINFKTDWKSNRQWQFRTDLEAWTDFLSRDSAENFQGNPRQFYLENKSSPVTVRLGYQTIVPDGPDILNPADLIHSKNWKDPSDPKTLSSAGLSLSQEIGDWQWEIFFVPQQTAPVLPADRSAWWPREKRLPIESEDTELLIPEGVAYKITDPIELDQALKNNFSLRLLRKSESFEGQLLYDEGLAQDPFLLTDVTATLVSLTPKQVLLVDSPVRLKPLYYRRQAAAATFLIPVGQWVLKGGGNWQKPRGSDERLPSESSTAVLGLEKNFETRKGVATFILQHEAEQKLGKSQISFMRSIFENAWSLGLRLPWGEETQFLGGVIYDTVGKSTIYRVSGSHRLTNSFSAGAEVTFFEGPEDTLLGLYDKYDHFDVNLSYYF